MPASASAAEGGRRRLVLEVCVDSLDSAQTALANGADRLEVCGALGVGGGLSPSVALLQLIRRALPTVPLMVMVRPRPGDFVYSPAELELMEAEVALVRTVVHPPVSGFVFGCLTADGYVDEAATRRLVAAAAPAVVTFHRAFDMVADTAGLGDPALPEAERAATLALEAIERVGGISRVLTSGLAPSLPQAAPLVARLAQRRPSPGVKTTVRLLPGSGLSGPSLGALLRACPPFAQALTSGAIGELHASCSAWEAGPVVEGARREGMGMGVGGEEGEWERWAVKADRVRALRGAMDDALA